MRIAVVGGTGPFGSALATRLREVGHDIVLGSRDAARATAAGAELGVEGATNEKAVHAADLVVLTTKAEAALDAARELREAIGATRVLSVASELRFAPSGVLPAPEAVSLAERIQAELAGPVLAGLHSLAASTLGSAEPPDEDAFVCGDDLEA
ncbi:MAG: NAD(P)-binding domain-containing protein, partial [Actinomycetota bacterium]|nr:NAD(P)-binding domain-containing protein [Actinomycetota bacterium]